MGHYYHLFLSYSVSQVIKYVGSRWSLESEREQSRKIKKARWWDQGNKEKKKEKRTKKRRKCNTSSEEIKIEKKKKDAN